MNRRDFISALAAAPLALLGVSALKSTATASEGRPFTFEAIDETVQRTEELQSRIKWETVLGSANSEEYFLAT